jgi:hypothetical protein
VAAQIRTPIFFVNAAYDSWQVRILFLKKHQFIFGLVFFWYVLVLVLILLLYVLH